MKIFSLFLYCFVIISVITKTNIAYAQTGIDSLKIRVNNELDYKKQAAIYYDIAEFYYYTNLDSSLYYAQHYLESSKSANDTLWTADAHSYIAYVYDEKGKIKLALEHFRKALDIFIVLKDSFYISYCYINIGYMTSYGMDQAKGLSYFLEAMQIAEAIQDTGLIADASSNIAYYYDRVDDHKTALRYYQKALKYSLAAKDSVATALSLANLASMKVKLKNTVDAKNLLARSKQMMKYPHSKYQLAYLYSSYIDCYLLLENKDSAQFYINAVEKIIMNDEYNILKAYLCQQQGNLAYIKKEYQNCLKYLDDCIALFKNANSIEPLSEVYSKQAEAYSKLQMPNEAYETLQLANTLKDSLGYGVLANMLGEFEQMRIDQIEMKKNSLEVQLISQKQQNDKIKLQTELRTSIFLIVFLFFTIVIVFYFLWKIRKKNATLNYNNALINDQKLLVELHLKNLAKNEERLKELNATKDMLFSIIAHDLRSPFSCILGFSELLSYNFKNYSTEKSEELIGHIHNSAKNTLYLLENLLAWARAQTGKIDFEPVCLNLSKVVEEIVSVLKHTAEIKNISLNNLQTNDIEVYADQNMLQTILRNLVSNAIKYAHNGGDINIYATLDSQEVQITVSDNGVGMSEETVSQLFIIETNITTKGTANEKGSGLGLILCKEFVEKHDGKIWAESQERKGSKFSFTLPLNRDKKNKNDSPQS